MQKLDIDDTTHSDLSAAPKASPTTEKISGALIAVSVFVVLIVGFLFFKP
jgi:hypothetical protein